ncbi:MAG: hypothetical protein ACPG61_19105 [Paracoccaceae bacterium]
MTVTVELPSGLAPFVGPDGRLTIEGIKMLQRMVKALEDHEARLVGGGL